MGSKRERLVATIPILSDAGKSCGRPTCSTSNHSQSTAYMRDNSPIRVGHSERQSPRGAPSQSTKIESPMTFKDSPRSRRTQRTLRCSSTKADDGGSSREHCGSRLDRDSLHVRMYEEALHLARSEQYEEARVVFEHVISLAPTWEKPWVSYAQMEKRIGRSALATMSAAPGSTDPWKGCRNVLQRALRINPRKPKLTQAWGLMELQRGNFWPAVQLLERSVLQDPILAPVLRWKPVVEAKRKIHMQSQPCHHTMHTSI